MVPNVDVIMYRVMRAPAEMVPNVDVIMYRVMSKVHCPLVILKNCYACHTMLCP